MSNNVVLDKPKQNSKKLEHLYPEIAKEWHPTKNGELTPFDVTFGSCKKVWWQCKEGHEWEARVNNRTQGRGCPYCAGQKISIESCLATLRPDLAKEWHPTKNGNLTPYNVTCGSNKKVWWICEKGHEWEATTANRIYGRGCPYCAGKKVSLENSLSTVNPELAKEWHPTKNGSLTPYDVTYGSNKIVWWLCKKGHEWKTQVKDRTHGKGCPYCAGRCATFKTCLATMNPDLTKEWHSTKNGDLTPFDVTCSSNKKVWWICSKGHEWEANVNSRSRLGHKCPYCSGKKVCLDNCLNTLRPALANEWHPTKNGELTPYDVTISSRKRVWWKCEKGHEWETKIYQRTNSRSPTGCPYCSHNKICYTTSLSYLNPNLLKEWDYSKNKNLMPEQMGVNSNKKVSWICSMGHKYEAPISQRTRGWGCPYCSGQRVCRDNCLATLRPDLTKEWHPSKNGDLTPFDVTCSSNKKVWWKCEKGHEWMAIVGSRNAGSGCGYCSKGMHSSFPEQAIHYYVKKMFPNCINGYKYPKSRYEIDIYIPEIKIGIEYDGQYFHKNPIRDIKKSKFLKDKVTLIRIRNIHSPKLNTDDKILLIKNEKTESLEKCIKELLNKIQIYCHKAINIEVNLEKDRTNIYNMLEYKKLKKSLSEQFPHLAREWHPTKNGKLSHTNVHPKSNKKVWWKCEKGHEWETVISNRTTVKGKGCPYCSGRYATFETCLASMNPELTKEWHPTKNGDSSPYNISNSSSKKVWWKCSKGHEWKSTVSSRNNGAGCPYCSGRYATPETCLAILRPDLAKEWHPTKNGKLTPYEIGKYSGKKVWWKCSEGHEWEALISNRSQGNKCPYCRKNNLVKKRKAKVIVQLNIDGSFCKEYEGATMVKEFADDTLRKACRGQYKNGHKYKGYLWYYKSDYEQKLKEGQKIAI